MTTLTFNMLLATSEIPTADVRLLRHQDIGAMGQTPYNLWRDRPDQFELYQARQRLDRASYFKGQFWASFVVAPDGSTLFVGLYRIGEASLAPAGELNPLTGCPLAYPCNRYETERVVEFDKFAGRLKIDWGDGTRSWVQKADGVSGDKQIVELTKDFREPVFPGYARFITNLSELPSLPAGWITALCASGGIYLLTCPKTKEQYVGSAYGEDGFWGRWQSYYATGHGGNVGLKSREPSDYQISILEVAGSTALPEDVIVIEQLWKNKLQSRDMGLNRN